MTVSTPAYAFRPGNPSPDLAAHRGAVRSHPAFNAVDGVALSIATSDAPSDVIDLLFLQEFTAGTQPFSRCKQVNRPRPKAPLRPAGAQAVRLQRVRPLPFAQAAEWLGRSDGIRPDRATLAELYALRDGTEPLTAEVPQQVSGMYL